MKLRMISRWAVITLVVVVALIAIIHQIVTTRPTSQTPPSHPTPTHTTGALYPQSVGGVYVVTLSLI